MAGENCRTGCQEKNHANYAECLQGANVTIAATLNSPLGAAFNQTKTELKQFREVAGDGMVPEGTTAAKIQAAKDASKLLGRPYNGEKDPPTRMIVNKDSARFVNAIGD
jgi:hypothetical protein